MEKHRMTSSLDENEERLSRQINVMIDENSN
jgi:hypothetical protein